MSKSPVKQRQVSGSPCPLAPPPVTKLKPALTLDDETKAETAQGEVGEDGLFLRLVHEAVGCLAAAELEGQGELRGLHVFFDLEVQFSQTCFVIGCSQSTVKADCLGLSPLPYQVPNTKASSCSCFNIKWLTIKFP